MWAAKSTSIWRFFFLKLAYFFAYHLNSAAFGVPIYEAQTMRIDPNPRTPTESRITR